MPITLSMIFFGKYLLTQCQILRNIVNLGKFRNNLSGSVKSQQPTHRIWALCHDALEFFTIGLSDTFLSAYLTDLKLHRTK